MRVNRLSKKHRIHCVIAIVATRKKKTGSVSIKVFSETEVLMGSLKSRTHHRGFWNTSFDMDSGQIPNQTPLMTLMTLMTPTNRRYLPSPKETKESEVIKYGTNTPENGMTHPHERP